MSYRLPRGTADILPTEAAFWHWLEQEARSLCHQYGFAEVRTPLFEEAALFQHSIGATSDIIHKEMYVFSDRSQRQLALRPEGTAGAVRALIQHKAYDQSLPVRWYYWGPMFRYENPQAGRSRQFHQFGVEAWGETDPALDADCIQLGQACLRRWGLPDAKLLINSVGDAESRAHYRQCLTDYLQSYREELPALDQQRLENNPLRVLDSKEPVTRKLLGQAPQLADSLTRDAQEHWEHVCQHLEALKISYQIEPRLVRGLDYYTHTVFEWVVNSQQTQAGTVGGGGRYDQLVQSMGGPALPGCGFAFGLERILLALRTQERLPVLPPLTADLLVVVWEEALSLRATHLLQRLREAGLRCDRLYGLRSLRAQLRTVHRRGVPFALLLGSGEAERAEVVIKTMASGEQEAVAEQDLIPYLQRRLSAAPAPSGGDGLDE